MARPLDPRGPGARAWPVLLALGLPALAAALLGGDSNWDLRNYHLYGPHALLAGRHALDVAPAQLQTWHNPLLDLPHYLLATSGLPMRLATLWLVLPAMLALWSVLRLQALCSPAPPRPLAQAVLALLVLGGAAFGSTLGLTMNDGFVAAGMLAALWLAFDDRGGTRDASRRWLLAGLVAGATAGLKLSAGVYCIALACAALPGGDARARVLRLGALALGGVLGVALAYGWWGWRLAAEFGNPLFPYFNQWLQSPAALPWSWSDARFRPASLGDALLAPLHLLRNSTRFSELQLRDPRLMAGLLAAGWLCWRTRGAEAALRSRLRALALFLLVGAVLWLAQSGIYRYAIVLEALGALLLVLALQGLRRGAAVALVLALVLVTADTRRPHWGREASGASLATLRAPPLGDGALVLTASGDPLAYLALGLPREVPLVGLANNLMQPDRCAGLQQRASRAVRAQRGPLWLLEDPTQPTAPARALLATHYGLTPTGQCVDFANPLAPARLCALHRTGPPRAPCLPP